MRKRSRIILTIVLLAILGGVLWPLLQSGTPEPVYNGKPLTFWLQAYDGGNSYTFNNTTIAPTRAQADAAIRAAGTNAIPTLLSLLATRDSPVAEGLANLAQNLHLMKIHYRSFWIISDETIEGFQALGAQASNAVPQLIALYHCKPNLVSQQTIPAILGNLGPPAQAAAPLLALATRATNEFVRNNAVVALSRIHPEPALAVPALIATLQDSVPNIRANAARALADFGKDAQTATPALLQLWRQESAKPAGTNNSVTDLIWGAASPGSPWGADNSRQDVINALKRIDPEAAAKAGVK